ncbi:MAG: POSSIBLE RNA METHYLTRANSFERASE (RNA METHYLASE), partial [uncultured Nocardioides sp.]
ARAARAVRPDAPRPRGGRRRPLGGGVAGRREVRRRAAPRRRPPQRRRPLSLLVARGDRGRPRHPSPRLPRGHRELAARLQHRHDRADRQRVPRRGGPHRRQPALEPPWRDGHRPLPARAAPRGRARAGVVPPRAGPGDRRAGRAAGDRQPARLVPPRDDAAAPPCVLPLRPGGARALGRRARGVRRDVLHRAVRLHPLDQRELGRRDRHARLGARARRPVGGRRLARL